MTTPSEPVHDTHEDPGHSSGAEPTGAGIGSIRGYTRTVAADSQGPLHTGDGDQHNVFYSYSFTMDELHTRAPGARRRAVGRVTHDEVDRVLRCFVRPAGFDRVADLAARRSTLVLSGEPGSGRRAAAIRLLQDDPASVRDIRVLPDADDERPYLDADSVDNDERLLLELSSTAAGVVDGIHEELAAYCQTVSERGARLVVVVSEQQVAALRTALPFPTVRIERPDRVAILRSHLAYSSVPVSPDALDQGVRTRLDPCTADEAAHVADLVTEQWEQAGSDPPNLGELVREATQADNHWANTVGERIDQSSDLRQRAVLLAAAMLHHCSTDAAFEATERLLACAADQDDRDEPPRLARQGFIKQLQDLEVKVRPDRTFALSGLNYAAAVRNRFWDEFPDQHDTFRAWVEECSRSQKERYTALDAPALAVLGQRFAEQHLRTRGAEHLLAVADTWKLDARRTGICHSDLMLGVLEVTLNDEQAAPAARERMRAWAKDPRLAEPLAQLLIVVCERTVAPTHPQQAVVRLRHLVRHSQRRVADRAESTLIRLAAGDATLRRTLIRILANRMCRARRSGLPLFASDRRLLRRATDPALLIGLGHGPTYSPDRHERAALTAAMAEDATEPVEHTWRWLRVYARDHQWAATLPPGTGAALPARLESVATVAADAGRWKEVYATALRFTRQGGFQNQQGRRAAELLTARLRELRGITLGARYRTATRKETQR